jgi:hypothetical protein
MGMLPFIMSRTAAVPDIQRVPMALSHGLKLPKREADHSPPSTAQTFNAHRTISKPMFILRANSLLIWNDLVSIYIYTSVRKTFICKR